MADRGTGWCAASRAMTKFSRRSVRETSMVLLDVHQVDDEDQRAACEPMAATSGSIGEFGWDHQLPTATHPHSGDAFLPTGDQPGQWEDDGLSAIPRSIELLAGCEVHADVMHLDGVARGGLLAVSHHDVRDLQHLRWRTFDEVDLWLLAHLLPILVCGVFSRVELRWCYWAVPSNSTTNTSVSPGSIPGGGLSP